MVFAVPPTNGFPMIWYSGSPAEYPDDAPDPAKVSGNLIDDIETSNPLLVKSSVISSINDSPVLIVSYE